MPFDPQDRPGRIAAGGDEFRASRTTPKSSTSAGTVRAKETAQTVRNWSRRGGRSSFRQDASPRSDNPPAFSEYANQNRGEVDDWVMKFRSSIPAEDFYPFGGSTDSEGVA